MKRIIAVAFVLALLVSSVAALGVSAKNTKFTFNDVEVSDGTIVEIEAASKSNNKGDFITCNYYSDDYGTFLGQYSDDTFASSDADEVLAFCVDNFDNRDSS